MKIQLLPTTFDQHGKATQQQHLCCFVVNDCVAVDAGSLAMATTPKQKESIRNVVLSHAHLDHIAGLPIFIDDLFATLESPIVIHATQEVIDSLENNIFNWDIYPRFSELKNEIGDVIKYRSFNQLQSFEVEGVTFKPIEVNHKVPTAGFVISDEKSKIALTSDTSKMDVFWKIINEEKDLNALLIECAFPNHLSHIANNSYHLTPQLLKEELAKFEHLDCEIYVINIKPMYRDQVIQELLELNISDLNILEIGKDYTF